MSKLIIITGFLATLKTTISLRLSKDLGIPSLNKDSIKEILGETIGFTNREENLKLSFATFQLMKFMMMKNMDLNIDTIIESNFKPSEIKELENACRRQNIQILTIYLFGDVDVLYQRYIDRQPNRHPVHTSTGLISYEMFKQSMSQYRKEDCIGEVVSFDTTKFNEDIYHDILHTVEGFSKSNT
ncbi:MAG: hypothetical protein V3569_00995 [Acholeplasmataceae bacterium]|nr:hypothetical protein [Acholeplasmataceae bacterium]